MQTPTPTATCTLMSQDKMNTFSPPLCRCMHEFFVLCMHNVNTSMFVLMLCSNRSTSWSCCCIYFGFWDSWQHWFYLLLYYQKIRFLCMALCQILFTTSFSSGDFKKNTDCSQPVTQANEAYGLLPIPLNN